MLLKLANHNKDIQKLIDRGYAVDFDEGYLVIRDIPYLDNNLELKKGAFVTKLVFVNQVLVKQHDHQVYFAGSSPYNLDGKPIPNIGDRPAGLSLSEKSNDIFVERRFSNKPRVKGRLVGFNDFYEKIESYSRLISGPAQEKHDVNPYTFRTITRKQTESVFKFQDTLTSRAEIFDLNLKFKEETVAIIGLGGTGSYILDFIVKTPVKEVRGFDLDSYYVHNAFRSPGKLDEEELGRSKVDVYSNRYSGFRNGLYMEKSFIDETSSEKLKGVTFAFVCVDKGESRSGIIALLEAMEIPFIDVGMGLTRKNGMLKGMIRTSLFTLDEAQIKMGKERIPLTDGQEDLYKTNIQIGELNALNACLAVVKYKQFLGFYLNDEDQSFEHLLNISDISIVGSCDNE